MIKPKGDLEPIVAYTIAIILIVYLFISYDTFSPDEEFPSSWKAGLVHRGLIFLLEDSVGRIIGKGGLLFLGFYCIRQLYTSLKPKKKV
ncbi:hypothetical protein GQ41_3942 [Arenibacter algicola]|uniref:Uncharacterized protein n=1 Tax=Arenibacter algicola TaxID=616991 RepID=A0ABY3AHA4_9FLAO